MYILLVVSPSSAPSWEGVRYAREEVVMMRKKPVTELLEGMAVDTLAWRCWASASGPFLSCLSMLINALETLAVRRSLLFYLERGRQCNCAVQHKAL